jgi:Cdc6-like AAA superfamily ATPase
MSTNNPMIDDQVIAELKSMFGTNLTSGDIRGFCASRNLNYQTVTRRLENFKIGRGRWNLEVTQQKVEEIERTFQAPAVLPSASQNLIPVKDDTFVKFGNFNDIKLIIQSNLFYPTFITGLSGNGKTLSVEQACSQLKRELIRVNVTIETDEDDLIGGSALLMVRQCGTMDPSLKHSNVAQSYFSMKLILHLIKFFAFNPS